MCDKEMKPSSNYLLTNSSVLATLLLSMGKAARAPRSHLLPAHKVGAFEKLNIPERTQVSISRASREQKTSALAPYA